MRMHVRITVHENPRKRMHMQISKDGDPDANADANICARRSANADANLCNIIIIYHDFLPTPRRGSHSHV